MKLEDVEFYDTPWGKEARCRKCGSDVDWQHCYNCEDGYSDHDCGEDTCCCRNPEPNVICDVCDGKGGWYVCLNCDKEDSSIMGETTE